MRTFAFCLKSSIISVHKAAGVKPHTCPPLNIDTFDPALFGGYGFYYFKLHGMPNECFWYGDDWVTACSAGQLSDVDMRGAVAFVANCHSLHTVGAGLVPALDPPPMIQALFDAGAVAIVAGPGENYARTHRVAGADVLGRTFRMLVCSGMSLDKAFSLAKLRVQAQSTANTITGADSKAADDTLEFELITQDTTS